MVLETKVLNSAEALAELKQDVAACCQCALHEGRTNSVFSDGNPQADIMIIGEGPGQKEDETGLPFVGRSGQLLTRMIEEAGLSRQDDVYICNIVKCRPPNNRAPLPAEMATCLGYLHQQIQSVQPKLILLAGATAVKGILKKRQGITKIRGGWYTCDIAPGAVVMPLFHPSYLLRNPKDEPGKPKDLMRSDLMEVVRAYKALPQLPNAFSSEAG